MRSVNDKTVVNLSSNSRDLDKNFLASIEIGQKARSVHFAQSPHRAPADKHAGL